MRKLPKTGVLLSLLGALAHPAAALPHIPCTLPRVAIASPRLPTINVHLPTVGGTGAKAFENTKKEGGRAWENTKRETERTGKNLWTAAATVVKTGERTAHDFARSLADADRRLREGKPIDAACHLQTDRYRSFEKNALRAAQESNIICAVGQVAAASYGPAGAAAYQTWFVARSTNDLKRGLKAGAIAGATAFALGKVDAQHASAAVKVTESGAVSGAASAAGGGSFKEGFRDGTIAAAAKLAIEHYTESALDARPGDEPVAKGTIENPCNGRPGCTDVFTADDMRRIPAARNHTGMANLTPDKQLHWYEQGNEGSALMTAANKIPGVNAMSYFHDIASTDARLGTFNNVITIVPATAATYIALGTKRDATLRANALRSDDKDLAEPALN